MTNMIISTRHRMVSTMDSARRNPALRISASCRSMARMGTLNTKAMPAPTTKGENSPHTVRNMVVARAVSSTSQANRMHPAARTNNFFRTLLSIFTKYPLFLQYNGKLHKSPMNKLLTFP